MAVQSRVSAPGRGRMVVQSRVSALVGGRLAILVALIVLVVLPRGAPNREILTFFLTLLETSGLENYHELEVSKYKIFSKCSTHGHYVLRKSCIFEPRIRGSFRDLKFPRKYGKC